MPAVNPEVRFTNLDEPLFAGAEATKRDLVTYLEAVQAPLLTALAARPLSVIRALRGQRPFMQKNLPAYAPRWIPTVGIWAERARREVAYPLCNDLVTLQWFANQRAVEFHPSLLRLTGDGFSAEQLVLDLDPPEGSDFGAVVRVAALVRAALEAAELRGAVKTSGAKGLHVVVHVDPATPGEDIAAATRALAARAAALDPEMATTEYVRERREGKVFIDATRSGAATVISAYSPRIRPGVPVSFPVSWSDLDRITPADFTLGTAPGLLDGQDRWAAALGAPQTLPEVLITEGRAIPVARVAAMHEGLRRARQRRSET